MQAIEFDLIEQYFTSKSAYRHNLTEYGIGDDGAVLNTKQFQSKMVVSADMLCEGTHFLSKTDPMLLGFKSLAVNVSDMLAMGATPKVFTLCLSMPEVNKVWLERYSTGLMAAAQLYNVDLIGGDTTRGPLTIAIQIIGESFRPWYRSGAQPGDCIGVTGTLGDAACGLSFVLNPTLVRHDLKIFVNQVVERLQRPLLPIAITQAYNALTAVNAAIDLSDGLLSDLGHVCRASSLSAWVDPSVIPISEAVQALSAKPLNFALTGGEDYQLCLTFNPYERDAIQDTFKALGINLTVIGEMGSKNSSDVNIQGFSSKELAQLQELTFCHF